MDKTHGHVLPFNLRLSWGKIIWNSFLSKEYSYGPACKELEKWAILWAYIGGSITKISIRVIVFIFYLVAQNKSDLSSLRKVFIQYSKYINRDLAS